MKATPERNTLLTLADDKADDLRRATKDNMVDYAATYGEFEYQAGSWPYPRRVVFKIEKPANQMGVSFFETLQNIRQLQPPLE